MNKMVFDINCDSNCEIPADTCSTLHLTREAKVNLLPGFGFDVQMTVNRGPILPPNRNMTSVFLSNPGTQHEPVSIRVRP